MNFCTSVLETKIHILNGRVSEEGYDVTNLLETNKSKTQSAFSVDEAGTGFMVSRFTRPPVTIRLDFTIPINISHIVIEPKLGQQISSGFKIEVDINSDVETNKERTLHKIGKEFLHGPTFPSVVVFRNPRFVLHRKYSNLPVPGGFEDHQNNPDAYGLQHPIYNSCERVFSLYLTIEKAEGPAKVPVLRSLQVWGQPSTWANFTTVKWLLNTYTQSMKRTLPVQTTELPKPDELTEPESKRLKPSDSSEIPEEFLDPITFEVMNLPTRLPCGVAVDSTTLERYSKEEATWGRNESDPFTGKFFTEDSRPLPDLSLKSRIDSFLALHATEIVAPRILGGESVFNSNSSRQLPSSRIVNVPSQECASPASSIASSSFTTRDDAAVEESNLTPSQILDLELTRILNGSRFKVPSTKNVYPKCFHCSVQVTPQKHGEVGQFFYKSSCNHVILCRMCLVQLGRSEKKVCATCNSQWSSSTLVKICI